MLNLNRRLSFAVAILLALPATALADRIVMKNGDVITGEISAVTESEVTISPAYADDIAVDRAEVASIDMDNALEVKLADGQEVSGQIALDDSGEQLLVVDQAPSPLDLANLLSAAEPRPYFEWGANVDFNATFNSGNTDSQNTLLFMAGNLRHGDHRHLGDLTFRREETENITTKEQDLLNYAYNWMFSDPWYMGATFSFERDPVKDLKHRYTAGMIFGRDIFDDGVKFLTISLGAGYTDEEFDGTNDSGAVGLWNLRYTHTLWGGVDFYHNHSINQQFYGVDNLIFKSNTGFRMDLFENLYATASLRYDYETEPAPDASEDDSTLALGLGYKF